MHLLRTLPRFHQNRFLSMPHTFASSTKVLLKLERGIFFHAECLSPSMRNWKPSTRKERLHCIGHAALKKVLFAVSRLRGGCVGHIEVVIGRGSQAHPLFCACQWFPKLLLQFLSTPRIKINTILFCKTPVMSINVDTSCRYGGQKCVRAFPYSKTSWSQTSRERIRFIHKKIVRDGRTSMDDLAELSTESWKMLKQPPVHNKLLRVCFNPSSEIKPSAPRPWFWRSFVICTQYKISSHPDMIVKATGAITNSRLISARQF